MTIRLLFEIRARKRREHNDPGLRASKFPPLPLGRISPV